MAVREIHIHGKSYEIDATTFTNKEGMDIERVTDMTFDQWNERLAAGSMLAMTALVWILLKRDEPTLRFSEVEFTLADLLGSPDEGSFTKDESDGPSGEFVPGGATAEFDAANPTSAPVPSTDGAPAT